MGFPVGYYDHLFPILIFLLSFLRRLVSFIFAVVGLGHLLDSDDPWPDPHCLPELCPDTAILVQEFLPVGRFDELLKLKGKDRRRTVADGCAVCLFEFEDWDEVRWLSNCRHVFHRECLDRWVDHGQLTCPLCRALLVPEEKKEAFDQLIWTGTGVSVLFSGGEFHYSLVSS